jgi:hypothetical protein
MIKTTHLRSSTKARAQSKEELEQDPKPRVAKALLFLTERTKGTSPGIAQMPKNP